MFKSIDFTLAESNKWYDTVSQKYTSHFWALCQKYSSSGWSEDICAPKEYRHVPQELEYGSLPVPGPTLILPGREQFIDASPGPDSPFPRDNADHSLPQ